MFPTEFMPENMMWILFTERLHSGEHLKIPDLLQ